jgi:hypothetical protein
MSNLQKLLDWVEVEKTKGLIDIKLFPRLPGDPEVDLETAAGDVLALCRISQEGEDITNLEL